MSHSLNPPKAPGDAANAHVHLHPELQKWVYKDLKDNIEYEYDEEKRAWFPMWNEALINAQQSIYDNYQPDITPVTSSKRTIDADEEEGKEKEKSTTAPVVASTSTSSNQKKKRRGNPKKPQDEPIARPAGNASIYVTGLPVDVDTEELASFFSKCGMLMDDVNTGRPKIKIYCDSYGNPKGDALVTYYRPESVALAIQLLDGVELRLGKPNTVIHIQEAVFKEKPKDEQNSETNKEKPKVDKKLAQKHLKQMEKKLNWHEAMGKDKSLRFKKIVVLKHMFTTEEIDEDPTLLLDLKMDIRTEAEKIGEVTNVIVYDKSPEGVCSVRFKEAEHADKCVKLMNGRYFGGRQVEAHIHDGKEKYEKSSGKDEEAASASYEKWLTEE